MCGRVFLASFIVAGCLFGGNEGRGPAGTRRAFPRDPGLTLQQHRKIVGLLRALQSENVKDSEAAQKELFEMGRVVVRYARHLLSDPRENVRYAAVRVMLHNASKQNVEDVIELLNDPHPLIRHDAAIALKRHTGLTFGFNYTAPPDERKVVILKWKQWLRQRD